MTARARLLVVPVYLFLCLVLGGSAQGVWNILVLQLLAIGLIAWSLLAPAPEYAGASARLLGWLTLAAVLLILLQLLPLPPALWTLLPGRQSVTDGYQTLGMELHWLSLSLAPTDTIAAALALLPSLAILVAILRLGAFRARWIALSIVLAALAGVVLGALQITAGLGYLYPFTSAGRAAGFFANANYMGTLLLAALPFLAALLARYWKERGGSARKRLGMLGIAAGTAALLLLGMLLNGSAAAALLSLPVLIGCAALLAGKNSLRGWIVAGAVAAGIAGSVALATVPALSWADNAVSVATRKEIWSRSLQLASDVLPVGSGLGTFPRTYPRYEDPDAVDWIYVNHVHNDYLEWIIETGLPGAFLLAVFFLWWLRRSMQIWRSPASESFAKAATIASAAILAHSAVDFPVRTAAIAAVLAASVALMAEPRPRRQQEESGVRARPARHLTLP